MNAHRIDLLNIGLVALSLGLSYLLPFELFLFSYAVLGPLHYATELNWLQGKQFFSTNGLQKKLLLGLCLLLSIPFWVKLLGYTAVQYPALLQWINAHSGLLLLLSLLTGLSSIIPMTHKNQWLFFLVSIGITFGISQTWGQAGLWIALLLPTLIHVYGFTLLFMWYGVVQHQSRAGRWAAWCVMAVPLIIVLIPFNAPMFHLNEGVKEAISSSGMPRVSEYLARGFLGFTGPDFPLLSAMALKIQVFIAFAYTYHYLNWFSKTTLIGWHRQLTTRKSLLIGGTWLCSVGLYTYDYSLGLHALFFLSLLHVIFEFPLNALTLKVLVKRWTLG